MNEEQLEVKQKTIIKKFIDENISFIGDDVSIKNKTYDLVDGFYLLLKTLTKKE